MPPLGTKEAPLEFSHFTEALVLRKWNLRDYIPAAGDQTSRCWGVKVVVMGLNIHYTFKAEGKGVTGGG